MKNTKPKRLTARATRGRLQRLVSRHREVQALEALVALALRNNVEPVTAAEIERYTRRSLRLTREDQAALDRARPKLLAALKRELRPDAKRLASGWDKPANESYTPKSPV